MRASVPFLLTPSCLAEMNRIQYAREFFYWSKASNEGFFDHELELLNQLQIKTGSALCLGSGGGREAFALARMGMEVTGVDQVPELVRFASDYAREQKLAAEFFTQNLLELDLPRKQFDFIFIWNTVYSHVPSKEARISLLVRLRSLLHLEGKCAIHFLLKKPHPLEERWIGFLRAVVTLVGGNRNLEIGDRITSSNLFIHFFPSEEYVHEEAREAGFQHCEIFHSIHYSTYAILSL